MCRTLMFPGKRSIVALWKRLTSRRQQRHHASEVSAASGPPGPLHHGQPGSSEDHRPVASDCGEDPGDKKEEAHERERAVEQVVAMYVRNDMIDIPFIPDFLERRIYRSLLSSVLNRMEKALEGTEVRLGALNHALRFDVGIRPGPLIRERLSALAAREKDTQATGESLERERIVARLGKRLARHYHAGEDDESSATFLGRLERSVCTNALRIVVGVLRDTLHTTSVEVLGHRIDFRVSSSLSHEQDVRDADDEEDIGRRHGHGHDHERRQARRTAVEELVEEYMTDHAMFLVPDSIERRLYTSAADALIGALEESVGTLRVSALNSCIGARLVPIKP